MNRGPRQNNAHGDASIPLDEHRAGLLAGLGFGQYVQRHVEQPKQLPGKTRSFAFRAVQRIDQPESFLRNPPRVGETDVYRARRVWPVTDEFRATARGRPIRQ